MRYAFFHPIADIIGNANFADPSTPLRDLNGSGEADDSTPKGCSQPMDFFEIRPRAGCSLEEAAPRLVKAVVTNEEFECKG